MKADVRIAIVGGGIVGSALALQLLREAGLAAGDICIFEREPPREPAADAPPEQRVYALSPASMELLAGIGVWSRLDRRRIAAIEHMRVCPEGLPADSPDALRFDAAESGAALLGAIAGARAVQAALHAACRDAGIGIVSEPVESVEVLPAPVVRTAGGLCTAELLVGADGARSAVRAAAGIAAHERDYGQTGIVATVQAQRPPVATAFQRFLDTGPLALLPLPGGLLSIVWSATASRAEQLLALDDAAFSAELTRSAAAGFGELVLCGPRAAFALRRLQAAQYVAGPCVLVGDAAHVIHPLAGQGVNQGLGDARALAAALAGRPRGEGVAARRALRRYERERRLDNALMGTVVDSLDRMFTGGGALAQLAGRGMALAGQVPPLRHALMRGAAGRSSPRR
ncbi:MAG: FAD-dependent monooxygenase [Steroidobacteraceae bacterium]